MRKRNIIALLLMVAMLMFTACGGSDDGATERSDQELTKTASYEDTTAEIHVVEFTEDEDGSNVVRVSINYTNNTEEPLYMLESYAVKAFQNDTELSDVTDINEGDSANLITEIKNGESIEGVYVFALDDDSPVEVRICTPTADEDTLAIGEFEQ